MFGKNPDISEFVHLHNHSTYSVLDGYATPEELAARAAHLRMPAIALTDHGTLAGAVPFYRACKKHNIKPIIGMEAYLAPRKINIKTKETRKNYHITLLATSNQGWRDLCQLNAIANTAGFYYKPRIDKELLQKYGDNLIVLSGCPSGELSRLIQDGKFERAKSVAAQMAEMFPGRYVIELMSHDLDFMADVWPQIIEIADGLELPMVVTNDAHYAEQHQRPAHDLLKAIGYGQRLGEGAGYNNDSYYLRTEEEMRRLFPRHPAAANNTLAIAQSCHWNLEFGNYHLPPCGVENPVKRLEELCYQGMNKYHDGDAPENWARLTYELNIIQEMGFSSYFLIFHDLIQFCKRNGIIWNIRGSAAGSLVAYCLGMTGIDPMKHDLIFERFLNPDRVSMPDIDMDVPDHRRGEVIMYLAAKYSHVAHIGTFSTFGAKRAIRDAAKALGLPWKLGDEMANDVPDMPGTTLEEAQPRLDIDTKPKRSRIFKAAKALEGRVRHVGTHAGGILVGDRRLTDYIPLRRPTGKDPDIEVLSEVDMTDCERLGLLKLDVLGLRTLRQIEETLRLVNQRYSLAGQLEYSDIPTEDEGIWEILSSGDTTGVFQVASQGFRGVLQQIKPHKFEHIVAALALYRPGPMDHIPEYADRLHGEKPVTYPHPLLEPILEETYGVLTYQEQVMRVCTDIAGFTMAEADIIRKAVGKKKKKVLLKYHDKFVEGAQEKGLTVSQAEHIWNLFIPFSRYGFNKAHATDYAVLTARTAWLRYHYPLEFMTALFITEGSDKDAIPQLLQECRAKDIEVLTPSIQTSERYASIENGKIRLGLQMVKFLGEKGADEILKARESGPFTSPHDFSNRVNRRRVNIRAITALAKVGAFDCFGNRLWLVENIKDFDDIGKQQDHGQQEMFRIPHQPGVRLTETRRLDWERILLGGYVTGHPLYEALHKFQDEVTTAAKAVGLYDQGELVSILGVTQRIYRHTCKNGREMAFITLEDIEDSVDIVVFPDQWSAMKDHVEDNGSFLLVKGTVDHEHGDASIVAKSIRILIREGAD